MSAPSIKVELPHCYGADGYMPGDIWCTAEKPWVHGTLVNHRPGSPLRCVIHPSCPCPHCGWPKRS